MKLAAKCLQLDKFSCAFGCGHRGSRRNRKYLIPSTWCGNSCPLTTQNKENNIFWYFTQRKNTSLLNTVLSTSVIYLIKTILCCSQWMFSLIKVFPLSHSLHKTQDPHPLCFSPGLFLHWFASKWNFMGRGLSWDHGGKKGQLIQLQNTLLIWWSKRRLWEMSNTL